MNKKHWITIVLDKDVDEPLVQQLLEESKIIADNVYNTIGIGMLIVRNNIRQSDICKVIIKCEIN